MSLSSSVYKLNSKLGRICRISFFLYMKLSRCMYKTTQDVSSLEWCTCHSFVCVCMCMCFIRETYLINAGYVYMYLTELHMRIH